MKQAMLAAAADQDVEFERFRRPTRRDVFLQTMHSILPWVQLCAVIQPPYPLHGKVFNAIHVGKQRLEKPDGITEFATKNGVDPTRLLDAVNSFAVAAKAKQANTLAKGYGVQGTPSLGVDGRWFTSGSMTGSNERALAVAEFLIGEARRVAKT